MRNATRFALCLLTALFLSGCSASKPAGSASTSALGSGSSERASASQPASNSVGAEISTAPGALAGRGGGSQGDLSANVGVGYAPSPRQHVPPVGSGERSLILQTLNLPIQSALRQPVTFECDVFEVMGPWAFVRGIPRRPGGKPVDYSKTGYGQDIADGFFEDGFSALLHFRSGSWRVVTWEIGATDAAWAPWAEQYGAPPAIFK
jgi:hypothetical protein